MNVARFRDEGGDKLVGAFDVEVPNYPPSNATKIGLIVGLTLLLQVVVAFTYGRAEEVLSQYVSVANFVTLVALWPAIIGIAFDKPNSLASRFHLLAVVVPLCLLAVVCDTVALWPLIRTS